MGPAALQRACLAQQGAIEDFPFGPATSVFKVRGKMFALSALRSRPLMVSLKCEPELAHQLRTSYPEIQPGYHLNKRHWNTVTLDGTLNVFLLNFYMPPASTSYTIIDNDGTDTVTGTFAVWKLVVAVYLASNWLRAFWMLEVSGLVEPTQAGSGISEIMVWPDPSDSTRW